MHCEGVDSYFKAYLMAVREKKREVGIATLATES